MSVLYSQVLILNISKFQVNKWLFLKVLRLRFTWTKKTKIIYCSHLAINSLQKCQDHNYPTAASVLDAEWDCKRGNSRLPETPLVLPGRECPCLPRDPPVPSEQQPQRPVPVRVLYILYLIYNYTTVKQVLFLSPIVNRSYNGWHRDAFSLKSWALRWARLILTK